MEQNAQLEELIQKVIVQAKSKGMTFQSDTEARSWATGRIKKAINQDRFNGSVIACRECKAGASNKETGPLLKYKRGGELYYIHQNCVKDPNAL